MSSPESLEELKKWHAEALKEIDARLQDALRKVAAAEESEWPAAIIQAGERGPEPGPTLVKTIDDEIGNRVKRITHPWLLFGSILGAVLTAVVVILQIGFNQSRDAVVADQKSLFKEELAEEGKRRADLATQLGAIGKELEAKKGEVEGKLGDLKGRIEVWQAIVSDAERRLASFEDRIRTATNAASRADADLKESQGDLDRVITAMAPTLQRMLEVIAEHPESRAVLDLQGVPVGGVVVLNRKHAEALMAAELKREKPSWMEANNQPAPPDCAYLRLPGARPMLPDLRPLTTEFVRLYGAQFLPDVTFVIRINP
jgi:hypothetical protein